MTKLDRILDAISYVICAMVLFGFVVCIPTAFISSMLLCSIAGDFSTGQCEPGWLVGVGWTVGVIVAILVGYLAGKPVNNKHQPGKRRKMKFKFYARPPGDPYKFIDYVSYCFPSESIFCWKWELNIQNRRSSHKVSTIPRTDGR